MGIFLRIKVEASGGGSSCWETVRKQCRDFEGILEKFSKNLDKIKEKILIIFWKFLRKQWFVQGRINSMN